jgi:hypothetical protein
MRKTSRRKGVLRRNHHIPIGKNLQFRFLGIHKPDERWVYTVIENQPAYAPFVDVYLVERADGKFAHLLFPASGGVTLRNAAGRSAAVKTIRIVPR